MIYKTLAMGMENTARNDTMPETLLLMKGMK
jgi:hypothetical protein